jgi:hypothetical protein
MAGRVRQRQVSTAPLLSAAASSSSTSITVLTATQRKTTTIEVVSYFPPDIEVILEKLKSWTELPQRPSQDHDHPDPDDDYCYHIESVVAKARVKIDGLYRLRFLVR